MFGWKITIFKKRKGIKVDPVVPVKKVPVDAEYVAWKKEQDAIKRKEIYGANRNLKSELINERIAGLVDTFKRKYVQPFSVGEMVIANYYGGYNEFSLGWYGSPQSLYSTFDIEELNGPWKALVHKIFINDDWLRDKLDDRIHVDSQRLVDANYINVEINNILRPMLLARGDKPLFEWAVDFDWHALKFPYKGSKNEEGYLDLRWGGFSASYFVSAETPYAKKQRKLWKTDKKYRELKLAFDAELKAMKDEIDLAKNNLI